MSNRGPAVARLAPSDSLNVARVTQVRHWSPHVFSFRTTRPPSLRFRAGEFLMLGLAGIDRPVLRPYSIVSATWDDELEFHSIKLADGRLTARLQHVKPGNEVYLARRATGTLVLDALTPGRRLFLLATGTGIAPFMSVLREPVTWFRYERVALVHSVRSVADLAYRRELERLLDDDPMVGDRSLAQLTYLPTVTREPFHTSGRIQALLNSGALFSGLPGQAQLDPLHDRLLLCGSKAMLKDWKALLEATGFGEGSNALPGEFVIERAFVG